MDLSLELCDFSKFIFEKMTAQWETLGNPLRNLRTLGKCSGCANLSLCVLCAKVNKGRFTGYWANYHPVHFLSSVLAMTLGELYPVEVRMRVLFELKVCVVARRARCRQVLTLNVDASSNHSPVRHDLGKSTVSKPKKKKEKKPVFPRLGSKDHFLSIE